MNTVTSFEVKPNAIKNFGKVFLPLVCYLAFGILGYFLLKYGASVAIFFGIIILICAASAIVVLIMIYMSLVETSTSMILTQEGIKRSAYGNHLISWQHIESIEAVKFENKRYVGLQLKPETIKYLPSNVQKSISFNKNYFGYDVLFDELEIDRPVFEFIKLLEQYRR
jgi:hypothetical protein